MLFGYAVTIALAFASIWLLYGVVRGRKYFANALKSRVNWKSLLALVLIASFFLGFALLYVHPAEQLYFDENIYQGIALNILHNGNAVWCQYGTGYLTSCPVSEIYHDPAGISFFLAIAFAIFGIGTGTAYGMELLIGVISIILTFVLASLLFKEKKAAVASTVIFALMPELFIWSRTQAVPDLIFMMFTILAFIMFLVVRKEKNAYTLSAFLASLALASYMRLEGILLIAIFAFLYLFMSDERTSKPMHKRIASLFGGLDYDLNSLILVLLFLIIITPAVYFVSYQLANPQFGQSSALFSFQIFESNMLGINSDGSCMILGYTFGPNVCYFLGTFNTIGYYPTVFPEYTAVLAVLGIAILAINSVKRERDMYNALLLLLAWIIVYYLFYDFFYAGSVTYGVDVRFMLQILPPIALLGGIFVSEISNFPKIVGHSISRRKRRKGASSMEIFGYAIWLILLLIAVIAPFAMNTNEITVAPAQMPQQSVVLPAMSFFYSNYSVVPKDCLVFSYTPDMWYEVNRSSAQIGYLDSTDANFTAFEKNYNCFVLDVGYWCAVPPNIQTHCFNLVGSYSLKDLASVTPANTGNATFGFYQILNYTP